MNDNYKNLIILGNGFDLHLGLPTKWSDFVEFYEIIMNNSFEICKFAKEEVWAFENFKLNKSKWNSIFTIDSCLNFIKNSIDNEDDMKSYTNKVNLFIANLKQCKMLSLLLELKKNNNEYVNFSWSDFEHLIEEILDSVDEYVENLLNRLHCADAVIFMNELLRQTIENMDYKDDTYFSMSYQVGDFNLKTDVINSKNKFLDYIFNELIKFTSVYKMYIDLIVDNMINDLHNTIHVKNTLILTFNYTQDIVLFDDFVGNRLYIHGKADNDIIIGISNDQEKEERIKFSKNYMRVYNRVLDNNNKDNINQINKYVSDHTFSHYYFLGHSLDKIDHSFLKQLFKENIYTKTTIFYYTDDDMLKKIFNLYLMVGEKYMTQMLNNGSLEFIPFDRLENYDFNNS